VKPEHRAAVTAFAEDGRIDEVLSPFFDRHVAE